MEQTIACQECGLNEAGSAAQAICSICESQGSRRRYCIAFNEKGGLRPFLAADDENLMNVCSSRLHAQGHKVVTLRWSEEHDCYESC